MNTGSPRFWLSIAVAFAVRRQAVEIAIRHEVSATRVTHRIEESLNPRVVFVAVRISGFMSRSLLLAVIASRYLPMLNLTAVFPLPNTS